MTIGDVEREFQFETCRDGRADNLNALWLANFVERSTTAFGDTESDAVCTLLKARYDIQARAEETADGVGAFMAWRMNTEGMSACTAPTELAAVVALARRIRGAG